MKRIKEFLQRDYISEIASSLCLIAIGIIYTAYSSDGTFLVFALTIGIFILIGSITSIENCIITAEQKKQRKQKHTENIVLERRKK